MRKLLAFLLFTVAAHASVTITANVQALSGGTSAGAYILVTLQNCSDPTIVNVGTPVPLTQKFYPSGGIATFTLYDNVTQIACDGNLLSYYTFALVSNNVTTQIKNVELPPGTFNLANLANVTTPPFNPGVIQGPQGIPGPTGPAGCTVGGTCTGVVTTLNTQTGPQTLTGDSSITVTPNGTNQIALHSNSSFPSGTGIVSVASGVPGLATGGLVSSTLGTPPGLATYGDSISSGTGTATPLATGYAFIASQAWGGPQTVAFTSRSGEQAMDGGTFLLTPTANGNSDYIVEYGTNDVTVYNSTTNLQKVFQRVYLHDLLWPSAVSLATLTGSCTTTGTWTADNSLVYGMGQISTTNGSTLSCPIAAAKSSSALYIGYHIINGNGGTFTVSVDGTVQTDPISGTTTFSAFGDGGSTITTQNGGTYGVAAVRLTGFAIGSHTVLFTVTSSTGSTNIVEPDYVAFAPASAAALPYGVAVTPNPQNNANSSLVATYDGFVSTIQGQLATDGWNVVLANTNNALTTNASCTGGANPPFTNCYADAIHPNTTGHAIMAATIEASVPAARLTSVQIPNNNQATDITQSASVPTPANFWSPNPYGAYASSTKWQPGVSWSKGVGLSYSTSFLPGYGILTTSPTSAGRMASWCPYSEAGYANYPTTADISTICPLTIDAATNGGTISFMNQNGASTFAFQASGVYAGQQTGTIVAPSKTWLHYFANTYFTDQRVATSSNNYESTHEWQRAQCWNGTVGTVDDFAWVNVPGAGASPTQTMTLRHQNGCGGALKVDLTAATGGVSIGSNVVYRCTTAGTLPVGALTTVAGNCGASVTTALSVN